MTTTVAGVSSLGVPRPQMHGHAMKPASAGQVVFKTNQMGFSSGKEVLFGKALLAYEGYRAKIRDFKDEMRINLGDEELSTLLVQTSEAINELRQQLIDAQAKDNTILGKRIIFEGMEATGVAGMPEIEGQECVKTGLLKIMREQKVCAAKAAEIYLNNFNNNSCQGNIEKDNYGEIESLLVEILNLKRKYVIEDIKKNLDGASEPNIVVVCRNIPNSQLDLIAKHPNVIAAVREEGGAKDHNNCIISNNGKKGITGVNGICGATKNGDSIIIDFKQREVVLRPDRNTRKRKKYAEGNLDSARAICVAERDMPSITADGVYVHLGLNISSPADIKRYFGEFRYAMVNLFRTEYVFGKKIEDGREVDRDKSPKVAEQIPIYQNAIAAVAAELALTPFEIGQEQLFSRITFRTADLDGDKAVLPYLDLSETSLANIKNQGFKVFLDKTNYFLLYMLFTQQLEALMRTEGERQVMFPNVLSLEEFAAAYSCAYEISRRYRRSTDMEEVLFGVMAERPELADELNVIAMDKDDPRVRKKYELDKIGFFSIGTQDLTRYTIEKILKRQGRLGPLENLNRDRPELEGQEYHPEVIGNIRKIAEAGEKLGKKVSVCGNIGDDPVALLILMGMGIRSFSVSPDQVDIIRKLIRGVNFTDCKVLANSFLGVTTPEQVKQTAESFVSDQIQKDGPWASLFPIRDLII